jgi:YYY domain-containing protein
MADQQNKSKRQFLTFFLLIAILIGAGWARVYNLNWDKGTHLHPDERYLTMVTAALELPPNLSTYWNTATSSLNPGNRGYEGYVYGTLPLFLTRIVARGVDAVCTSCTPGHYLSYHGIHLVGRALSTIAELGTLLLLVGLAYLMFNDSRIALLTGALYAGAVLPIQHSHFFVVDNFATFFVLLTLSLAVYAVEKRCDWPLLLAGAASGLALACKVSVWPVTAFVGLAGLLERRQGSTRRYQLTLRLSTVVVLVASGFLAFAAFRTAQPYAFSGPGFFGIRLNQNWLDSMKYIRRLMVGEIDVPYGHQWTNRAPIVFPWYNMVIWGLGIPLGLTAWVGWAVMGTALVRKRDWGLLFPWGWATLFFFYQGLQWVKSMRYFLPVYPFFILFAAWLLWRVASRADKGRALVHWLRRLLPWIILFGTFIWTGAFLQIYVRPFTRIAASEWIYENVPTTATLHSETGQNLQLPLQPDTFLSIQGGLAQVAITPDATLIVDQLTLNKVTGQEVSGERTFQVRISASASDPQILAETTASAMVKTTEPKSVALTLPSVQLDAGKRYLVDVALISGDNVVLKTSVLANEHWDDQLPVRMEGRDPFFNWYRGLSSSPTALLNLYDADTAQKRESLLTWLDEADYIIMSSNRLYASIPRLPQRYPLTTAYYRHLFAENLGFDFVAEFVSYPSIGPCQFPDQELPFSPPAAEYSTQLPCSISLPAAEEAFSVYDHPQVFIFAKTDTYSRARVEALLPLSLTESVQQVTPREATRRESSVENLTQPSDKLLMSENVERVQRRGGTWVKLFPPRGWQNRSQVFAAFIWWLLLTLLGWLAFPWLTVIFPALRLRGYGLARIVGLLLWTYPAWLLSALHLTFHTRALLWGFFLIFAGATAFLVRVRWTALRSFIQTHWRKLLRVELLFACLYISWLIVRYLNPDLFHPVAGGEKPMDFAYLNAVIKSRWFPPYDPWFAGGIMNYYYFGFVLVGSLIEALGITASVAYNLAIPSLFAMTGIGGYTLASNLTRGKGRRAEMAGILGLLFTVVLGNLGELNLLIEGLADVGHVTFESLIPGYEKLVSAAAGLWKVVVQGVQLPFRPEWWYWNATRVIEVRPGEIVPPINEFPAFTFLYGDLHAHAIALPLTQVALAVALQWALRPRFRQTRPLSWASVTLPPLVLGALTAGALRATNTWDYPTYLGLMGLGYFLPLLKTLRIPPKRELTASATFVIRRASEMNKFTKIPYLEASDVRPSSPAKKFDVQLILRQLQPALHVLTPVLLFLLAELFFQPFSSRYAAAYTKIGRWEGARTPLGDYVIMHGQFLLPLILLALVEGVHLVRRQLQSDDQLLQWALALVGAGMLVLLAMFLRLDVTAAVLAVPLGTVAALLLLDAESPPRKQSLWLWVGTALTITLVVEIVVLKGDIGRMNTVFKPYMQVWMLLAVAAAVAVERFLDVILWERRTATGVPVDERGRLWQYIGQNRRASGDVILVTLMLLLATMTLYPLFAIPAKVRDRWVKDAPHTLDGAAYMPYAVQYENNDGVPLAPDAGAIDWLQRNVKGSPVIFEGQALREYLWGNRISIYTGLPTVIGWRWHQAQQRMVMPGGTVEMRQQDVRDFYNTPDPEHAWLYLQKYDAAYVVLTPYERLYMQAVRSYEGNPEDVPALAKFETLVAQGRLELVYDVKGAKIYRVVRSTTP